MKSLRVIIWNSEVGIISQDPNNPNYYLYN